MELPHTVQLVVVRRQRARTALGAQPTPPCGRTVSGPNSSKANVRCGNCSITCSMRASFASRSGSVDSFHVLVRWTVISCLRSSCRSRSRPTITRRSGLWARYSASLRTLQQVNGRPSFAGRVLAVATMNVSSSLLIRPGRPPAH